jgi:hypothetical protein
MPYLSQEGVIMAKDIKDLPSLWDQASKVNKETSNAEKLGILAVIFAFLDSPLATMLTGIAAILGFKYVKKAKESLNDETEAS